MKQESQYNFTIAVNTRTIAWMSTPPRSTNAFHFMKLAGIVKSIGASSRGSVLGTG
jgi:hypothetical protein